jgi:TolB-like protein/class 3 adenylate cyclase
MSSTRQLAAIMFTDIVGYTALMGNDEQKAFELLRKNRELQKPIIEQLNGRWIKELGDGVMASFHTVSDTVNAAIQIQEKCNTAKEFQLRIGIHLGEVVFENDDVFGDGVNIASRIQAIADPGSIFISETVHHNVSNKKDIHTRFIQEVTLKNVMTPLNIYEVTTKNDQPITQLSVLAKTIAEKSIAVLPFANMSSDPEQEYFSDGITEDIITQISKLHELKVISRTSIIQYKQTKKSLPEIASELKVSYLLEGSVRKSGNRLRIVSQLIDAKHDEHLWAETYDRDLTDIFAIQTEIAEKIANALKTSLTSGEQKRIAEQPTSNLEAYNFYLLGKSHYHKGTPEDFDKAVEYYNKAITMDPNFALAYASLAVSIGYKGAGYFGVRPRDAQTKSLALANKALELSPNLSQAYIARGEVYDWYSFEWDKAEKDYKKAIELNPNNADAHLYYALHLIACKRYDEAIAERDRAVQLDPFSVLIRFNGYWIPYLGGKTEQSLKELDIDSILQLSEMIMCIEKGLFQSNYGLCTEAISNFRRGYELSKNSMIENWAQFMLAYGLARGKHVQETKEILNAFHEKEKTEFVWPLGFALAYAHLGETGKALDYLEKSYEERVGWMLYIGCDPALDVLRKEKRFKDLVLKIGPMQAIAEIDKFG